MIRYIALLTATLLLTFSCLNDSDKDTPPESTETSIDQSDPPISIPEPPERDEKDSSCSTLVNEIKTLNISPENIIAPQNAEFPEGSKIIDIYEVVPLGDGNPLMCSAKVKIAKGNYPVRISLITEYNSEYIVIESQGKRKWILKWLND